MSDERLNPFLKKLYPKEVRSIEEFAEQEVILPTGPRKGFNYESDFMPFNRFIFEAIMDPYWRKVAVVGPTQSGKSLICINIPLLYILFELEEDLIFGVPQMDLAKGAWQQKILPVILGTKYQELLPTKGPGARGGTPTSIKLGNGVWIRFMGAGGGDAQRSSFTSPNIIMTEVDKMDDIGEASDEADPVSQIEMRADAFEESRIIQECTVTTEEGRIWRESMVLGSGGRIHVACPHCSHWQHLKPEGLIFDATNEQTAEDSARYKCESCEELWTNNDRLSALGQPLLVHKGQSIENDKVVGDLPSTRTFGLHYNVLYSPMQSLGKTAIQQYQADISESKELKKAMIQSKWALPWSDEDDVREISMSYLIQRAKRSDTKLRVIPDWTDFIIMEIDVQKSWIYWHVEAYKENGTSKVIEYGVVDIHGESDHYLIMALNEAKLIATEGWIQIDRNGKEVLHTPSLHLVDCGYRTDVILPWIKGKRSWVPVKGIGRYQTNRLTSAKKLYEIPGILQIKKYKNQVMWLIMVDETKGIVHDRYLIADPNEPGYTEIPQDATRGYFASLSAEKRIYDERRDCYLWEKIRRRNDYLDCRSYGIAGAMYLTLKGNYNNRKKSHNQNAQENKRQEQIKPQQKESWFNSRRRRDT